MLKNSFVFLKRIGYKTEERIWRQGILTWQDFVIEKSIKGVSRLDKKNHDNEILDAVKSLDDKSSVYFSQRMRTRDLWRLYPEFKGQSCFLDIETTGLSPWQNDITVVGIYDGQEVKSFVKGINLTSAALSRELERYSLILTFYGSAFDLPFLRKKYPEIEIEMPHIDLCFTGRRLGLRGGLKKIEKDLGIDRKSDLENIDGFEALRLWKKWEKSCDNNALDTLIEYNTADVVNLEYLAEIVYEGLKERTFNDFLNLEIPRYQAQYQH